MSLLQWLHRLEWPLLLNYLGVILGIVFALILIPRILRHKHSPAGTLAWILAVLLFPYIAAPLYALIGGRKIQSLARRKKPLRFAKTQSETCPTGTHTVDALLQTYALPSAANGHRFFLLTGREERSQTLLELIDSARQRIDVLMYLFRTDEIGRQVVEHLIAKSQAGVQVHLLLDKMGSRSAARRFLEPLLQTGGKLAFFLPQIFRSNLRNHRKMVIVDEKIVMAGGINIGNEYLGWIRRRPIWEDLGFVFEGPAASDYAEVFRTDWEFACGEAIPPLRPESAPAASTETDRSGRVQAVPSGPDVEGDPLYDIIMTSIFTARERIWIVTPYFVPDDPLMQALRLAAHRCLDIRILLPEKSDHRLPDWARLPLLRELQAAGAVVHFYSAGMMHAKAFIRDRDLAVVGSANFDMRSFFLNYEMSLCLYDPEHIRGLETWFLDLIPKTVSKLPAKRKYDDLFEGFLRMIAPLL
ncbi:MAG: cardiolipin synthase [Desulfobacteraceae bacterium]|nr:MAG: cardiolipin synthase [Desulfobacteraceae bacterium]